MTSIGSIVLNALRSNTSRIKNFTHGIVFGRKNLLITNALISALMGAAGDAVQQNYDILTAKKCKNNKKDSIIRDDEAKTQFEFTRTFHMTAAGLTTGVVTHYWYILLDRYMGPGKMPLLIAKKVLIDQIIFSPVNLFGKFIFLFISFV